MTDFSNPILNGAVLLVGLLLYVLAWRGVGGLPAAAKWSLRLLLALVILVPFAAVVLLPTYQQARAPAERAEARRQQQTGQQNTGQAPAGAGTEGRPAQAPVPKAQAPTEQAAGPKSSDDEAKPEAARKPVAPSTVPREAFPSGGTRGLTPPPKPGAAPSGGVGPDVGSADPVGGAPRSGAAPASPSADMQPQGAAPDRSVAAPPPPALPPPEAAAGAGEEKEDWTVVPVYYGTDRARAPSDKRLVYGSERARRLELGRALVTVPKKHEVPQIERPWAIKIPYFNVKIYEQAEDPKTHFTMQELKSLSEGELLALVKQRLAKSARFKDHAFVFVHGYNTTFDDAVYRTAQIAYDIKFDGAPFLYSWPSGGGISSYTLDGEGVAQAEPYLGQFLKMVVEKSGAKSISLIAHSMGNRLLLRVLQDLHRSKPDDVKISQIVLAAPDVDRDVFVGLASQLKGLASGGVTLYASAKDFALGVSRRFNGGIPRAGDVPNGVPVVVPGIDTIDATSVSMDSLGLAHSGYAESKTLLDDIGLLLETGQRPPEKRVPKLLKVEGPNGLFWRYP